jgi:subtilisin family serine protease
VAPIISDLEIRLGLRRLDAASLTSITTELVLFEIGAPQTVAGAVSALATDPRVMFSQPNYLAVTAADHRDPMASLQYGPAMIKAPAAHARVTGRAVRVAVIDTGVDGHHPDLVGRVVLRASFADGPDTGEVHGTAIAGVIAATADNAVGIYGVAPEASIIAIRACQPVAPGRSEGGCTSWGLARALDFAILNKAHVINLSVAGQRDAVLPRLIARAHDLGIVVVAAVGNLGPAAQPPYPATAPTVVAVTAVDARAAIYPAAVQGPFVSVAAPGVEILSTVPRAQYGTLTGTSMAAAHVSGLVALLLQAQPDLTPAAVRRTLETTAQRLGPTAPNVATGHGLVDGCRAVDATLRYRLGC